MHIFVLKDKSLEKVVSFLLLPKFGTVVVSVLEENIKTSFCVVVF